eukprot:CAMPEP_0170179208 /NCGR_PEP_ID=MMETSP0040_2-20121228/16750_1 /TAXON_ID=641309 /ORGANISM="Lotharella oceanica, Strain CCMP622" /LENGTH=354 /DNA_ID=CAMNT_0010423119 /DNA_START=8 /DNA_END=1072 /DNA_ORIENTATION=+
MQTPKTRRPSTLILAGTGKRNKATFKALEPILTPSKRKKRIIYVVTAALKTHYARNSRHSTDEDAKQRIRKKSLLLRKRFHCTVEIVDLAEPDVDIAQRLDGADVIFVEGGNTYYLRHHMRKSGFDQIVKQKISEGVTYVGCSAGAIVTGQGIGPAIWKGNDSSSAVDEKVDWEDPEMQKGLGLLPGRFVFPHYSEKYQSMVRKKRNEGKKIVTIPDEGVEVFTTAMDGSSMGLYAQEKDGDAEVHAVRDFKHRRRKGDPPKFTNRSSETHRRRSSTSDEKKLGKAKLGESKHRRRRRKSITVAIECRHNPQAIQPLLLQRSRSTAELKEDRKSNGVTLLVSPRRWTQGVRQSY